MDSASVVTILHGGVESAIGRFDQNCLARNVAASSEIGAMISVCRVEEKGNFGAAYKRLRLAGCGLDALMMVEADLTTAGKRCLPIGLHGNLFTALFRLDC